MVIFIHVDLIQFRQRVSYMSAARFKFEYQVELDDRVVQWPDPPNLASDRFLSAANFWIATIVIVL